MLETRRPRLWMVAVGLSSLAAAFWLTTRRIELPGVSAIGGNVTFHRGFWGDKDSGPSLDMEPRYFVLHTPRLFLNRWVGRWTSTWTIPAAAILALVAVACWCMSVFTIRVRRRRALPGACRRCGYNLAGNVSGRCPECGTAVVVVG